MSQGLGNGKFQRERLLPRSCRACRRRREQGLLCFRVVGNQQEGRLFEVRRPEFVATDGVQDKNLCK